MSPRRLPLVLCLALAGCPSTPVGPASIPGERIVGSLAPTPTPTATPTAGPTADLTGSLVAPPGLAAVPTSGLVSDQTGSLVSDQTGSLVSDQTGSLVSDQTGSFELLALAEGALGKTTVYLADATLKPIAGIKPVETDARGGFTFKAVPSDFTYQVVAVVKTAGGKLGRLSTLAKPGEQAAISSASTVVAASVVAADGGLPGTVDAPAYQQAIATTQAQLTTATVPDFADVKAVQARGAALAGADAGLNTLLQALKAKLATHPPLTELQPRLPQPPAPAGTAAPGPTPTPAVTATQPPAPASTLPPTAVATPTAGGFIYSNAPNPCSTPLPHYFLLSKGYQGYPLTLQVLAPDGTVVAKCSFQQPGAVGNLTIPEGCPHGWKLYDANTNVLAAPAPFGVTPGAPKQLTLPF